MTPTPPPYQGTSTASADAGNWNPDSALVAGVGIS